MKTPEQVARDMLDEHVRGVRSDIADAALIAWMTRAIEADRAQSTRKVHIVFDGPPAPESGRFIDTETPDGKGIGLGRWIERADGYWVLEIEVLA